jgi:hypothetical protein
MSDIVHHTIQHFNDIKLNSLIGNIRLNTTQQNKVYINSDNNTLTINENIALGFGKDIINYGAVGDVIISNGDQGSRWSNKVSLLENRIKELEEYIIEMKFFMNAFSKAIYLEETPNAEYDYANLL